MKSTSEPATRVSGRRFHASWSYGYELAFANVVIAIAPADGVARKTDQPDAESHGVPYGDEAQLFPEGIMLQAPNANHPGHGKAQGQICAQIAERDHR